MGCRMTPLFYFVKKKIVSAIILLDFIAFNSYKKVIANRSLQDETINYFN